MKPALQDDPGSPIATRSGIQVGVEPASD
jgi:hypothetical protein